MQGREVYVLFRPKKYLCFRLACVPKKTPSLNIFMEHLEKAVSCVILVPNRENHMKIRQEMAEYGRKSKKRYRNRSIFDILTVEQK